LTADAVNETRVLAHELSHPFPFAVVAVRCDVVNFNEMVLGVVGVAVHGVVGEISGKVVTEPAGGNPVCASAECEIVVTAAVINPAITVAIVGIRLRPTTSAIFLFSGQAVERVVAEGLCVAQSTAAIARALKIPIVVGRAIVVSEIEDRSWIRAGALLISFG